MDRLTGRLCVVGSDATLHLADGTRIAILDDGFLSRLLAVAPCLVGGHRLYDGACELLAEVDRDENRKLWSISATGAGRYQSDGLWFEF